MVGMLSTKFYNLSSMCGLATHYIPENQLSLLLNQLYKAENSEQINNMLNLFSEDGEGSVHYNEIKRYKGNNDRKYDPKRLEENFLTTFGSPLSISLSKRLLNYGREHSLSECLIKELSVVNGILVNHQSKIRVSQRTFVLGSKMFW